MPLIPRDGGDRHRIQIDADIDPNSVGDWYEIRTMLGYHARMKASDARAASMRVPAQKVRDGDFLASVDYVDLRLDDMADATHIRLMVWLTAWSHKEPLTSESVRRIPLAHAKAILAAIERYETVQGGPSANSPLPADSND